MTFTIAHSPDSDDAYMMAPWPWAGWIPTASRSSCPQGHRAAQRGGPGGRYDVTAISFGAYPELKERYDLLTAGSSIQEGTGPLVVSRTPWTCGS